MGTRMSGWHGYARDRGHTGKVLHVGPLPGRKSICIYTMDYTDGAVMHTHGYFRSEKEARKCLDTLEYLLGPILEPERVAHEDSV